MDTINLYTRDYRNISAIFLLIFLIFLTLSTLCCIKLQMKAQKSV